MDIILKILSSFTHPNVVANPYNWLIFVYKKKKEFLKNIQVVLFPFNTF